MSDDVIEKTFEVHGQTCTAIATKALGRGYIAAIRMPDGNMQKVWRVLFDTAEEAVAASIQQATDMLRPR